MKKICYRLAVKENNIVGIESLKQIRPSMFKFRCKGDIYICDVEPTDDEKVWNQGRIYYQCRDSEKAISNCTKWIRMFVSEIFAFQTVK